MLPKELLKKCNHIIKRPQINIFSTGDEREREDAGFLTQLCWYISSPIYGPIHIFVTYFYCENFPTTSQIAIIRWANVGIWLPTLLVRCCQMTIALSSGRLNRQRLVRSWSNALIRTIPPYANVMTITLSCITFGWCWSEMISVDQFIIIREKTSFPLLSVIAYNNLFQQPR